MALYHYFLVQLVLTICLTDPTRSSLTKRDVGEVHSGYHYDRPTIGLELPVGTDEQAIKEDIHHLQDEITEEKEDILEKEEEIVEDIIAEEEITRKPEEVHKGHHGYLPPAHHSAYIPTSKPYLPPDVNRRVERDTSEEEEDTEKPIRLDWLLNRWNNFQENQTETT